MKTLNLIQGDANWHAHRATSKNASDAPAMLGCSEYKTRSELLHEAFTGIRPEVTPEQQRRFDDGHAIEEAQLPGAEGVIGEQLYPVVGCERFGDIELSASFDGLTLLEDTAYECKTLNDKLRAALPAPGPDGNDAAALPKMYRAQMEQQLMVCGGDRVLFTAATKDGSDVRRCWYTSDPALRAEILAGWKQFDADLKTYVPSAPEVTVVPKATSSLPIVFDMRVEGKIVSCNVEQYKPAALAFIAKINTELTTDQHFADAKADATFCRDSADKLELAIEQALGQMGDINTAINTVREIAAAFDAKALALEKLVESQTKAIKESHVLRGQQALKAHIDALNTRLGKPYMPTVAADFGAAVKNKRTVESLRNSVDTELARAKIAANEVADRIDENLKYLRDAAGEYKSLFADAATIVLKAPDDLQALAKSRIADHKAEIARQAEAAAELARETIRKEEQAKAEKEAREKLAAEQAEAKRLADEQAARDAEAARQATAATAPAPTPAPTPVAVPAPAPAANVVPLTRPAAPPADTGARVQAGEFMPLHAGNGNRHGPLSAACDNVLAWRLGEACNAGAKASAGDLIDRGLVLLRELRERGFLVVQATDADRASSGATSQAVRKLTEPEIKALTAMVWGAPCSGHDLAVFTSAVKAMEALHPGERPIDPADGGRLLDVDACIVEPAPASQPQQEQP